MTQLEPTTFDHLSAAVAAEEGVPLDRQALARGPGDRVTGYTPRHRRCRRRAHHRWSLPRPTIGGWSLVTCLSCGTTELA